MRSGVGFVCGASCFLFGIGFYHYVLLSRQLPSFSYHLPIIGHFHNPPMHNNQHVKLSRPSNASFIPLEEVVWGPLHQNDTRILKFIHENKYLIPPLTPDRPYNLTHPHVQDTSMGQSKLVLRALNNMRGGFFVECGALDGELRSNTLLLERYFAWKGLLIEGDPKNFELLEHKRRRAWLSPSCLATRKYPHQVMFQQEFNRGRISTAPISENKEGLTKAQCFPLFSLLSALNVTVVDYLSLDVEGSELEILKTIPYDSVFIKVLSVEYFHDKGGKEAVRKFMTSKGYKVFGQVTDPRNWANDLIFVNNHL